MKSLEIKGSVRENLGKRETKQLRNEGKVPCVLYGGKNHLHFYAEEKDFKGLVYTPEVKSVSLSLGGTSYNAIMQDIQYHTVNDSILHVDFLEMSKGKEVKMEVPVKLVGTAAGVRAGGKLIIKQRLIKIKALPENLPEFISVNVENLEVGGTIKVGQIEAKNLIVLNAPNVVIATVKGKRVEVAAAPGDAKAAPAKGAAPAAAAKAAPAKK